MHLHPQRESTLVCLHRWVKHSRDDDFLYAVAAVFVLQTDCSALRRYGFFFFLFFFSFGRVSLCFTVLNRCFMEGQ